ncbi:MAG TPA: HAMP domain-containing sensor histidine kinase [Xanthomonadales bacterium]|nr:HAMP domain-containing sensor histidine kinase [Xanthomonadales bacterium]
MSRPQYRRSAFFRFAVALPLLLAALSGLLLWPIYREAVDHIRAQVHAAIERDSWDLEVEFHENGIDGLINAIEQRQARQLDPSTVYLLIDANGGVLAGSLANWPATVARQDRAWAEFVTDQGEQAEVQVFQLFGQRWMLVGRRSPLASFDRSLALQLGWTVAAMFALSAFAAAWFSARLRRRLRGLAQDAEAIRGGDLDRRLLISPRRDEIDDLAERFNRTFADLERLVDGARQVSSHLAHDLRRPLQAARQHLEELAHRSNLDGRARHAIEASLAEIDQLLGTFAALLRLARLQAGGFERSSEWIDLDRVVADAVELYTPVAQAAGHQLRAALVPCRMQGDRHLWFQLLQNLIENALNHGHSDIDIELQASGELSVRDHGPGVPPESLPHLGERFYRADPARSAPGIGIGLALAKAIAEHHGASLSFENAQPGLRARLRPRE